MGKDGPKKIKIKSEKCIKKLGGKNNKNLPILDLPKLRDLDSIIIRTSIVFAILQIQFNAPIDFISNWLIKNNLHSHLSQKEADIITKKNEDLTHQEKINLYWYIESLYALMWAGNLFPALEITSQIPNTMASLCPDINNSEGLEIFSENMPLRKTDVLVEKLDLFFRAHWYARDGQLNGFETKGFNIDSIVERRKALEWILNKEMDWDHTDLAT